MQKTHFTIFLISTAILILFDLSVSEAFAYLDPSSGSLVVQMILGALVGIGVTLKIYWYKIKERLGRIKNKTN